MFPPDSRRNRNQIFGFFFHFIFLYLESERTSTHRYNSNTFHFSLFNFSSTTLWALSWLLYSLGLLHEMKYDEMMICLVHTPTNDKGVATIVIPTDHITIAVFVRINTKWIFFTLPYRANPCLLCSLYMQATISISPKWSESNSQITAGGWGRSSWSGNCVLLAIYLKCELQFRKELFLQLLILNIHSSSHIHVHLIHVGSFSHVRRFHLHVHAWLSDI